MRLKKHGVIVDCGQWVCTSCDDNGCFDVAVPVTDSETDIAGSAKLHCTVSSKRHSVELTQWQDVNNRPIRPLADRHKRVDAALAFFADHRICGNRKICPVEVVRVVEKNGGS